MAISTLQPKSPSRAALRDSLESLMDAAGDPRDALELVVEICYGKANHLSANWQDTTRAGLWERWGNAVNRVGSRLGNPYR